MKHILGLLGALLGAFLLAQPVHAQGTAFGFTPSGNSQSISVTDTSSSITLSGTPGGTVLVTNTGSVTAYISNTATATTSSTPVPGGAAIFFNFPPSSTLAAVTASSTTTLLVSKGVGASAIAFLPAAVTIAGTVAVTQSGTWTVQPGNTANTTPWLVTPTPDAAAGTATTRASSTAAASNLVLKASAGNLYDLTVTIGATAGYLMLFDATSLPSNGAVTPILCAPVSSNGTNGFWSGAWPTPMRFGTGITAGFSTTGCFSLTASATGNFFGGYK